MTHIVGMIAGFLLLMGCALAASSTPPTLPKPTYEQLQAQNAALIKQHEVDTLIAKAWHDKADALEQLSVQRTATDRASESDGGRQH